MPQWGEVFLGEVTDSRTTLVHQGPYEKWVPDAEFNEVIEETGRALLERPARTVLRLKSRAHASTFEDPDDAQHPGFRSVRDRYWETLCEAHLPVVNELIQRYRLVTYDPFAYEVSPWDVPVWNLKHARDGWVVNISQYRSIDQPPVFMGELSPKKKTKPKKVNY